ncbi:1-acyl-sn-glycerol-3-phosphate acyltransferase delta-like [Rhincodon typus]|uniref:1-acyl-sn-glycerol-3-phosphate acyltransferase delta-like n=1 Tax=Rhincodon typus TaxID=259920 RepID=UPI00202E5E22|nr:1-acyl-sn-glycerol-3-phosphate acyltransferase delta-like [Rhincodon typus]
MGIVATLKSQFICHLLICYIFVVTGLIINFLQLCTLVIWPINKQLYRRINCRLAYCIASRKEAFYSNLLCSSICRRIPLEDIPEDENECAAWLHKLYQEKDMLQVDYFKKGFYPGTPIVPPKRPWVLVNWLFWAALLLFPLFKLIANMICNGSSLTLITFSLIIVAASIGMRWMIGMTEIERGSSYGNNDMNRKN